MDKDDPVNVARPPHERSHHELLNLLRDAIDANRLVPRAQPVVDLATGDPVKHELTLLLPAYDGCLISASEFHPVAERYGLLGELDDLLIRSAARLAAEGDAVALDIHAGSVADPDLARRTEQALEHAGASPDLMTFELSEAGLTTNLPAASAFVHRMHDLGCRITADEFGTGSSGFAYLKQLPLDCVKLDACFVERLESTPTDAQFVFAFVQLAEGLGLTTAADGVLDEASAAILAGAGVDQAQGTLFGGPVALTEGRIARLCDVRSAGLAR